VIVCSAPDIYFLAAVQSFKVTVPVFFYLAPHPICSLVPTASVGIAACIKS
jgi:hypothetical protein